MRGISACLLGQACRYDGNSLPESKRPDLDPSTPVIPLCPEQMGGLPTPRIAAQIKGGDGTDVLDGTARVINDDGQDVTDAFLRGAQEALALCRTMGITEILLKSRSPSCGVGYIYQGKELVTGDGVTAALLKRSGIKVACFPGEEL